ncbi:urea transporter [Pedobacter gandavensis]|uniref:urea transporter n=1 Tax=Pedobacter gandavensis TaxID=2679963 RepID=UPI002931F065|nr:urea transporter [Pedobacter gandavensis]
MKSTLQKVPLLDPVLKGIGQIMLQENAWTGLLFLAGIFCGSLQMGIGAILATLCGTITAKVLKYKEEEIESGLYGFSAALVGVALPFYFQSVAVIWIAIVIGAILATMLQHFFIVKKIPVFTFPFVFVTWILLYIFHQVYPVAPSDVLTMETQLNQDFAHAFRGFGQVIFQGGTIAGLLFFIAVFISSPISALYAMTAAVFAAAISSCLSLNPQESIAMGLGSYNAVLCAIVFAGTKVMDGFWVLVSVILALFVAWLMATYNFTLLTFPFVAGTCLTLVLKSIHNNFFKIEKPTKSGVNQRH